MELANCLVRLNGDIGYEVKKSRIPFAEVRLLQEIHGIESVLRIERAGSDDRKPRDVVEALKITYGEERFRSVFPGVSPNIALQLRDIVADFDETDDGEAPVVETAAKKLTAAGKGKPKAKAAAQPDGDAPEAPPSEPAEAPTDPAADIDPAE